MRYDRKSMVKKRIGAFLVDWFFTGFLFIVFYLLINLLSLPTDTWYMGLLGVLVFTLLFVFRDVFGGGRSIGKRILHLQIVGEKGNAVTTGQRILRNVTFFILYIELVVLLLDKNARTLGDKLSHTVIQG